jgi:hypothetical protein
VTKCKKKDGAGYMKIKGGVRRAEKRGGGVGPGGLFLYPCAANSCQNEYHLNGTFSPHVLRYRVNGSGLLELLSNARRNGEREGEREGEGAAP